LATDGDPVIAPPTGSQHSLPDHSAYRDHVEEPAATCLPSDRAGDGVNVRVNGQVTSLLAPGSRSCARGDASAAPALEQSGIASTRRRQSGIQDSRPERSVSSPTVE